MMASEWKALPVKYRERVIETEPCRVYTFFADSYDEVKVEGVKDSYSVGYKNWRWWDDDEYFDRIYGIYGLDSARVYPGKKGQVVDLSNYLKPDSGDCDDTDKR